MSFDLADIHLNEIVFVGPTAHIDTRPNTIDPRKNGTSLRAEGCSSACEEIQSNVEP